MSSQDPKRGEIDLDRDLPLTPEDIRAMSRPPNRPKVRDLAEYLDFLEEIGAFKTRKTEVKIYTEIFEIY